MEPEWNQCLLMALHPQNGFAFWRHRIWGVWCNKSTPNELFVGKTQWHIYGFVEHSAKFAQSSRNSSNLCVNFKSVKCDQINCGEEMLPISKKTHRKMDHLEYVTKTERVYA
jgi:hypothetical protein